MKNIIHKIIVWYLRRCGGAFHAYPYGDQGRYVVLMNETQYNRYTFVAEQNEPGDRMYRIVRAEIAARG